MSVTMIRAKAKAESVGVVRETATYDRDRIDRSFSWDD
jgi:hypothetical protein